MPTQGRPKGQTVRIQAPNRDKGMPSGRLFIGRGLYDAIGSPRRVALLSDLGRVEIRAGDEYGVVVPASGQPRLSLGEAARELLGLDTGTYPATVEGERIVVRRPAADIAETGPRSADLTSDAAQAVGTPTPSTPARTLTTAGVPVPRPLTPVIARPPINDGYTRIRGRRTLLRGYVAAHRKGMRADATPYHDIVMRVGDGTKPDELHLISGWDALPDQLRVGDIVEVTIERVGGNMEDNR